MSEGTPETQNEDRTNLETLSAQELKDRAHELFDALDDIDKEYEKRLTKMLEDKGFKVTVSAANRYNEGRRLPEGILYFHIEPTGYKHDYLKAPKLQREEDVNWWNGIREALFEIGPIYRYKESKPFESFHRICTNIAVFPHQFFAEDSEKIDLTPFQQRVLETLGGRRLTKHEA